MPIYEYRCESMDCQNIIETLQKMDEPELITCPKCLKDSLVKQMSVSSFRLYGTGWYKPDAK